MLCKVLYGQHACVPSGNVATGSGGSFSYTIGQMFYHSVVASDNCSCHEGVQHACELLFFSDSLELIEHHSGELLLVNNSENLWETFQWYHNGQPVGTDNFYFEEGGLQGDYYVVVTDIDGNETYSYHYFYAVDQLASTKLVVFPVPLDANKVLNVYYSNPTAVSETSLMSIFSLDGRLVKEVTIKREERQAIDLGSLSRASYMLRVGKDITKIIVP